MSRCDLTGKFSLVGNKVSHSNIKSRRRFKLNLKCIRLCSKSLGRCFKFRIAVDSLRALRRYDYDLDAFVLANKGNTSIMRGLSRKIAGIRGRVSVSSG